MMGTLTSNLIARVLGNNPQASLSQGPYPYSPMQAPAPPVPSQQPSGAYLRALERLFWHTATLTGGDEAAIGEWYMSTAEARLAVAKARGFNPDWAIPDNLITLANTYVYAKRDWDYYCEQALMLPEGKHKEEARRRRDGLTEIWQELRWQLLEALNQNYTLFLVFTTMAKHFIEQDAEVANGGGD